MQNFTEVFTNFMIDSAVTCSNMVGDYRFHLPWLPGQVEVSTTRDSDIISFRRAIYCTESASIVACTTDTTGNCSAVTSVHVNIVEIKAALIALDYSPSSRNYRICILTTKHLW